MRILAVVHHFPPDVNSTGMLMAQLFESLARRGDDIHVLTTFPHYEGFRTWPEYRGKLYSHERDGGVEVTRLYSYTGGTKTMGKRLVNYVSFNAMATIAGIASRRPADIVFCTNGSFFSGLTGLAHGLTKRAPLVLNLQDLYPDVPVRQGQLTSRAAITALEGIGDVMYRRATHLTVIADAFRARLLDRGVPAAKISVVPNFVDTEFIKPLPKDNSFSREHGVHDRFVIMHAGNLGYVYDLETLLDVAARLRPNEEIVFLIVGDGVARPRLEAKARGLDLDNVRFLPFQPRDRLPLLRASSDVQVSLYKPGASGDSMPSKIYETMASGRALLSSADRDSDVWDLVAETGCGVCVEPGNVDQLFEAVMRIYQDPALRVEMGRRGRRHAERDYSREVIVDRYCELFEGLVARSKPALL